jgi:HEAT repeat protein
VTEWVWRLLPGVRERERTRFLFFASLFGLIQVAQMLGLAGSEALFLSRVGVSQLPLAFILASSLTVAGSLLYAMGVDERRNDVYFAQMLAGAGLLLLPATWLAAHWRWPLWVLFCLYYLTFAVFQNHCWTFTGYYFDTLSSKRLFPLFTVGSSLGGFVGGLLATVLSSVLPPEALIAGWGVGLLTSAGLLVAARRRLRRWKPMSQMESDETSMKGMRGAARYMKRSPLSRWLLVSAASMVLALFVSQYIYSEILVQAFPSAESLATFLGFYLMVTNLLEVVIEVAFTPRLIQNVGVASANLVHPGLTVLSFIGLGLAPGLTSAVGARVNRELLENAVSAPIRNLIYNALPARFRGRMRAFLEGIVVYSGMTAAGVVLALGAGGLSVAHLSLAGGLMALLYLLANLKVRQEYLQALVTELRAGRLDLDEVGDEIGKWEVQRLASLWGNLLKEDPGSSTTAAQQLAPKLARRGVIKPLLAALEHPSPDLRRAVLQALAQAPRRDSLVPPILACLKDPFVEARRTALEALAAQLPELARPTTSSDASLAPARKALASLVADPVPEVRARAARLLGLEGRPTLEEMVRDDSAPTVLAALAVLEADQVDLLVARSADSYAEFRAAALERLADLFRPVPLDLESLAQNLRHPNWRVRRGTVRCLGTFQSPQALTLLASGLGDPAREVRLRAAAELETSGEEGILAAEAYLQADAFSTVEAALAAMATGSSPRVRKVLSEAFQQRVREAWKSLMALNSVPQNGDVPLRFLRAALKDTATRSRRLAFRILAVLEDPSVVRSVEKVLRFESTRSRADALEILSNLGERESAGHLVLMLEDSPLDEKISLLSNTIPPPSSLEAVLEEARASSDRWLTMAAACYGAKLPEGDQREEKMERLLILRRVPLFAQMNLEQLEAINQIVKEVEYLNGEAIFREGDVGSELFLLVEGEVRIVKNWGTPQELLLTTCQGPDYFGEMAILDDEPRSATVLVSKDARLLSLEGDRLKELILQMPEIAFKIFRVLTQRVRLGDQRLQDLMQSPHPESSKDCGYPPS